MHYVVKFDAICENCEKKYSGFMGRKCPENDSSLCGDTLNATSDYIDARLTKKKVENDISFHNYRSLEIAPNTCPACGSYQTWNPPEEPVKLEPNRITVKGVIRSALLLSIIVVPICLILYFISLFTPLDDLLGDEGILYFMLFGIIVSNILGILWCKSDIVSDEEYQEKLNDYEAKLQRYNKINNTLQSRTVHNLPNVNIITGKFTNYDPYTVYLKGGVENENGPYCPTCHKKLHGVVGMNSIELARAKTHCCPWCGASLPDHFHLNV